MQTCTPLNLGIHFFDVPNLSDGAFTFVSFAFFVLHIPIRKY